MWLQIRTIILVTLAATTVAACGFRPLYAERYAKADVTRSMEAITIAPIGNGRLGNELRRLLLDRLTPRGTTNPSLYRLVIEVSSTRTGLTVEDDETFSRFNKTVMAHYQLLDKHGETLTKGTSYTVVSSSVDADPYASYVGAHDAEQRATRAVADDIRMRLALFFDGIDG